MEGYFAFKAAISINATLVHPGALLVDEVD